MARVALGRPDGRERWEIAHDGREFLVLHHRDAWVVVDALCPHRQGRLRDGLVRGDALVCPSHWYTFDLRDGTCRTTPNHRLGVYPAVPSDDGDDGLVADIPEQTHRSWADVLRAHAQEG